MFSGQGFQNFRKKIPLNASRVIENLEIPAVKFCLETSVKNERFRLICLRNILQEQVKRPETLSG